LDVIYSQWGDNGPFRALAAFSRGTGDGVVYLANGSEVLRYAVPLARPAVERFLMRPSGCSTPGSSGCAG